MKCLLGGLGWWEVLSICLIISFGGEALKIEVYQDGVGESTLVYQYTDQNAAFDSRSYSVNGSPIVGVLRYPVPRNACVPVTPVPGNHSWFAFIQEYSTCPESTEQNLNRADFQLMLAASKDFSSLDSPKTGMPQVLVTSTDFITFLTDHAIVGPSTNASDVYLKVWDDAYLLYEKLIIVFGSILLVAVLLSVAIFCCSICCRMTINRWRTRGLSRWRVMQLPRRRYRKDKESTESCSICLEDFKEGENLRVLPCDHVFHPSCVDEWLQKWNRTCPLCKSAIHRRGRGKVGSVPEPASETAQLLAGATGDYGAVAHSSPLPGPPLDQVHLPIELAQTPPTSSRLGSPTVRDSTPLLVPVAADDDSGSVQA